MNLAPSQIALAGLFGLIIGSFLNVVIYRLPRGQSLVSPPSTCPRCDTRIRPIDNIPVLSWLLLRGRCHKCGAPISIQYPIVELVTGLLYIDEAQPDLHEVNATVPLPLARLPYEDLCPGREALLTLQKRFR